MSTSCLTSFRSRRRMAGAALCVFLSLGVLAGCNHDADLSEVCRAFTALAAHPRLDEMGEADRMRFVQRRLAGELWSFSHTMKIWNNVPVCEPSARYRIFKFSAEELLGHNWNCPEMERLVPSLSPTFRAGFR